MSKLSDIERVLELAVARIAALSTMCGEKGWNHDNEIIIPELQKTIADCKALRDSVPDDLESAVMETLPSLCSTQDKAHLITVTYPQVRNKAAALMAEFLREE